MQNQGSVSDDPWSKRGKSIQGKGLSRWITQTRDTGQDRSNFSIIKCFRVIN